MLYIWLSSRFPPKYLQQLGNIFEDFEDIVDVLNAHWGKLTIVHKKRAINSTYV